MAQKGFNAYKMAQEQFDKVAGQLELDQATRDLLRAPIREYHFLIHVRMDDGSVKVFKDLVKGEFVFILRRQLIPYVLLLCG